MRGRHHIRTWGRQEAGRQADVGVVATEQHSQSCISKDPGQNCVGNMLSVDYIPWSMSTRSKEPRLRSIDICPSHV
jgi:hypothetical protein